MSATTLSGYQLNDSAIVIGEHPDDYILRVRDLPDNERPREKMMALGPKALTVAELVAVLVGVGTRKEEVMSMAHRVLKEYGEQTLLNETNPQRLAASLDIPVSKAAQIIAGLELGRRFYERQAGRAVFIRNIKQAHQYLKDMSFAQKEQLRGLYLNSRHQVIHEEVISVGTLTTNLVHPREVFRPAVEHGAVAILIAHNHPSGMLYPTSADIEATEQLIKAGRVLGIDLVDHLIIAGTKCISLMQTLPAQGSDEPKTIR